MGRPDAAALAAHAVEVARRTRNDRWLAHALARQASAAIGQHDVAAAHPLLTALDEAATRAGDDPARFDVRGLLATEEGRYADALAAWRASRIAGDAIDHFGLDNRSPDLVHLLIADGRRAEAVTEARAHAARLDAVWQGDHWMVADAHELVAIALAYAHDFEAAGREITRVVKMHARMASIPTRAYSARLLAIACTQGFEQAYADELAALVATTDVDDVDTTLIDLAGSWTPLLFQWAIARAHPSAEVDEAVAVAALDLGDLELARTRVARVPDTHDYVAGRYVRGMLAARDGTSVASIVARLVADPPTPPDGAILSAAALELAHGDFAAARARAATVPKRSSVRDAILGRALEAAGDHAAAIPALERALFLAVNVDYTDSNRNTIIGDTAFALARAVEATHGDRARVLRLVDLARDFYPPGRRREREALTAWLASISSAR